MNTPICDFVEKYVNKNSLRLHMPGHKGKALLGFEQLDITEISGADSLFEANGIIKESENNASEIFNAYTFYSCEGSSLSIRAAVYLALTYSKESGHAPIILASRNAHKTFLSACGLLDVDIRWINSKNPTYLSAFIHNADLEEQIKSCPVLPSAVYITTPDYLGNITDLCTIAQICNKYNVLLIVDNAHGAYLKFLNMHPLDMGAHIVCDSAHKTLPVLTGGAYLHVSKSAPKYLKNHAKEAMALFASTSPSYLILQSLDKANPTLLRYGDRLKTFLPFLEFIKGKLKENGYVLYGNEPLKLTILTKPYGYLGTEFASLLESKNVTAEFSDPDFIVFMLPINRDVLMTLAEILLNIKKRTPILEAPPTPVQAKKVMTVREAMLSSKETISTENSLNRVLASPSVSCPPAVPIIACGELIDEDTIKAFKYYNITELTVVKE
jgi:arginine/lysine/ornithine decarboxylase